jgi:uncharacterized membrane protein
MNQQVYDIAKVLHIVGIVGAAGTCLIDLVIFRYFWSIYPQRAQEGVAIEHLLIRLQRVMAIGMMLIVVSGVMMMFYLHAVWGQQLWFRVKMGVLLLIIINGLAFRRTLGNRIHTRVAAEPDGLWTHQASLRPGITTVQLVQLMLFVIIFTLSVFKFN